MDGNAVLKSGATLWMEGVGSRGYPQARAKPKSFDWKVLNENPHFHRAYGYGYGLFLSNEDMIGILFRDDE